MATSTCASQICSPSATKLSSAAASWKDDPVSASFQLFSLIEMQDRFLEQVQAIDAYILELTEKIVKDAANGGHVGHGLLLLNRKCVAEGVRQVYLRLATQKRRQVRQCYNFIRQNFDDHDDLSATDMGESHDHEVTQIARGLSMECCAFQRSC
ncbi:uncharacterized protein LOC124133854 [Haliotis rufescens]|uniref:uncharacterized protein LOC124133854 n=1 Tax=Haliotis rufescens TaxID=6454 RepID=UPI00201EDF75|nr:uncharacterized protein LOC124133854 [Haliotis rufescens]